ncbi:MAG: hypothetical protein RI932_160 [Pseudomonadota bacterium]|jgi:tRNA threonylcarbamoyladenosine biosynthesis protein TsaE
MFKPECLAVWEAGAQLSVDVALSDLSDMAAAVSRVLRPQDFLLLQGDLGAGKTTLVSLMARALGSQQLVASPTFSLLNVIEIPTSGLQSISRICHMDLYRIRRNQELLHLGLELEFNASTLAIIEWHDNVDVDGWSNFFELTRCRKPRRVLTLSIENLADSSMRRYSFGWSSFSELTSE